MKIDVVIIGAGPGGYACAIRCSQVGLRTALVEEKKVGGVCLHWGCIPTKALYAATKLLHQAATAPEMGISFAPPAVDIPALAAWKDRVVETLAGGITTLLTKGGVAIYSSHAELEAPRRVRLATGETLEADRIVLATGSAPIEIPGFPFSDPAVWSSDDALALHEVPRRLVVIGGGVIGLELANIYRRLGSGVTVVELLPEILATLDLDRRTIAGLKRSLTAQGIRLLTGVKATGIARAKAPSDEVVVTTEGGEPLHADRVLVAVGRRPNSGGLGLDRVGLSPDRRGALAVDAGWRTAVDGIYAIGDLVAGPMLAHKATAEGVALADTFIGEPPTGFSAEEIPQAIFTDPEVASVGVSEKTAREQGIDILVGRFPYGALGKALGMREPDGFFQVVADAADHRVLGVQILGAEASDLIGEAAIAVRNRMSLESVAHTVHAHPTLPEGLQGAAEHALGRAIHTANR
ncbi:MAG: dihydrolipoyl dehydrogenase [Candidatus Bipolaricaulis sp.]|nr:dihydrolipoyl dehydrogenase [Candidatus Bipolaricaulis sp.]